MERVGLEPSSTERALGQAAQESAALWEASRQETASETQPEAQPDSVAVEPNSPSEPSRYEIVERNANDEDVLPIEASAEIASSAIAVRDPLLGDRFEIRTAYAPVRRPWMPPYEDESVAGQ